MNPKTIKAPSLRIAGELAALRRARQRAEEIARDAELTDEIEESLLRRYLDTEHQRRVQREYFFGDRR